jgi:hypothetical protein
MTSLIQSINPSMTICVALIIAQQLYHRFVYGSDKVVLYAI